MKPITAEDLIKEWYAEFGDSQICPAEVLRFVNLKQRDRGCAMLDAFNKNYLIYRESKPMGWRLTPEALELIKGE